LRRLAAALPQAGRLALHVPAQLLLGVNGAALPVLGDRDGAAERGRVGRRTVVRFVGGRLRGARGVEVVLKDGRGVVVLGGSVGDRTQWGTGHSGGQDAVGDRTCPDGARAQPLTTLWSERRPGVMAAEGSPSADSQTTLILRSRTCDRSAVSSLVRQYARGGKRGWHGRSQSTKRWQTPCPT
jgi:hypothetical protein